MDAKVETLELKKGNKLNSCKENDVEEKWKQHARARARDVLRHRICAAKRGASYFITVSTTCLLMQRHPSPL